MNGKSGVMDGAMDICYSGKRTRTTSPQPRIIVPLLALSELLIVKVNTARAANE